MIDTEIVPRRFLFLQGLPTRFFHRLGAALTRRGHAVHKVNFNGGDRLFWRIPGAIDYRGTLETWPSVLTALIDTHDITDIVLFGDCRPLHRVAIRLAAHRAIAVHVFEEGYLRPSWITHELGGVNAFSSLPRDPDWYRREAANLPPWEKERPIAGRFARRSIEDVLYNVTTVALSLWFAGYRTHRPWHPFVEYAGWIGKFARGPFIKRRAERLMRGVMSGREPMYLFPLQLDCDTQIREHSSFKRLEPAIDRVITSFARHAPKDAQLVLKEHPLDNGLNDWRRIVERIATARGVAARITYLDDGDLMALLKRARAVVTINSTVGTVALGQGLPTIALGKAIYDIPGLTYQGDLDAFWLEGTAPDPSLFEAFRSVIGAKTLIYGGFFSEQGLDAAIEGSIAKLEAADTFGRVSLQPSLDSSLSDQDLGAVPAGVRSV